MHKLLILASGSPRRKDLLTLAGVRFRILVPDVDETPILGESPRSMVRRLSEEKANAVWRGLLEKNEAAYVLSADTTVVSPKGVVLGKPEDELHAERMIRALQGRAHEVLTGYTLLDLEGGRLRRKATRVVRTRVFIQAMSSSEIKRYVALGESLDKAGAYAAQGFGMAMIESISGSYTNVIGLPMTEVMRDLKGFGWKP
ncbi:septum formation protein Maf [bacterium]|nr:septum formation protein Maf [bacterium]